jgi:hypothetical protein
MENKKITPITRINRFFSEDDFNLEQEFGREAIENDGNFVVILYKIDRNLTEYDDVYGEAKKNGIKFFPPIELKVIPILEEAENKTYNSNGALRYIQDGILTFGIYEQQLIELKTTINYGDYIGYPITETQIRYFSVVNDGIKNFDNRHTIMGYKPAFKTIKCAPIDETEFSAL